ncbi:hypothetical protein J437_LFUL011253 [Ladona fulva]|uniref:PAXIP1-associated glutamate-rich protein 1 n=1 Tax=Ladona fulva TaxID=123851 RepID=A0A8K0KE26_LADFU|nr:hypothetical protein J437_LFUL011253 [Ladona fulva]
MPSENPESAEKETEDNDWRVDCSDDERYEGKIKGSRGWEPSAEEIIRLYETLDKGGTFELEWQCPGRRAPSPAEADYYPDEEESQESLPQEKSDFDFAEEFSGSTPTPPRRAIGAGTPKGSAKKKTTSLDGVLSNMRRHRLIQQMERATEEASSSNQNTAQPSSQASPSSGSNTNTQNSSNSKSHEVSDT